MYKIRIKVKEIEGNCHVLKKGDEYLVQEDGQTFTIIRGEKLCIYALSSLFPFIPAMTRELPEDFWMSKDTIYLTCPDPGKSHGGAANVLFELKREKV
ncbi:MAG: TIGR04076 family protein [Archaeoglobus sp.]|nr:TIGR04076 family protein [Archaeoglobus sp.]